MRRPHRKNRREGRKQYGERPASRALLAAAPDGVKKVILDVHLGDRLDDFEKAVEREILPIKGDWFFQEVNRGILRIRGKGDGYNETCDYCFH